MKIKRAFLALLVLGAIVIAVLGSRFFWAKSVTDDIINSIEYSAEIGFGSRGKLDILGHEVREFVDFESYCHRATFDLAFRRCREFECYYPTKVDGARLGRALSRVKSIEIIHLDVNHTDFDIPGWEAFLNSLRDHPNLKKIIVDLEAEDVTAYILSRAADLPFVIELEN